MSIRTLVKHDDGSPRTFVIGFVVYWLFWISYWLYISSLPYPGSETWRPFAVTIAPIMAGYNLLALIPIGILRTVLRYVGRKSLSLAGIYRLWGAFLSILIFSVYDEYEFFLTRAGLEYTNHQGNLHVINLAIGTQVMFSPVCLGVGALAAQVLYVISTKVPRHRRAS